MDKQSAIKLIRETFENSFDKERFVYFIKNLFNKIGIETGTFKNGYYGQFIPESFKPYIKIYKRIGKYNDGNDRIDVLVVYLEKEKLIERARTMQRNFIAGYLNGKYGSTAEKNAALVAFISPNEEDWRFSLVKMEYKLTQTKTGRPKGEEEFTPAKRFSFLVGRNEPNHTAQSQLYRLLKDDINNPTLTQLEDAFNIEKVTKEFFENYRDLFIRIKEAMDNIVHKDPAVKEDFAKKGVDTVDFAKKLMGQIVFLYFLQKKGWFGVEKGKDWGTGSKRFLRDLYEGKIIQYKNFFNDVLEPLFYDALARDRSDIDHYNEHFKTKIPFLNGGLFDPINNYDWVNTDILLPDELFSNDKITKQGDKGDGILDVFDRYNFTVKEDEPLEREVAIDPEMLGKVFENLLEIKNRKSKGSYYTPREIVHYMCQESLINYLTTELSPTVIASEAKQSQIPPKEDIKTLIHFGDFVIEHDIAKEKGTKSYKHRLPESIRYNVELIDEKLENIRICDPAIGSGAFPVGMMTEIVRARNVLTTYFSDKEGRTIYNFKRHAIQNCLYGVDIDPSAVDIAKLRLWLSLVVDEEDIKQIKPLPNLDYKIMQGNSLLEEYEGIKLFDERIIEPAYDLKEQKKQLQERQSELQREYFKLHFSGELTDNKKEKLMPELKKIEKTLKKMDEKDNVNVDESQEELFNYLNQARKKAEELKKLHEKFFKTYQREEKGKLKERIERIEWELIEATLKEENKGDALKELKKIGKSNIKPYFLWKLNFEEIFQEKGGFDVVIANPPYDEISNKKDKKLFQKVYFDVLSGHYDLYIFFFRKSFDVAKKGGFISFITPHTYLQYPQFKNLRKWLYENSQIIEITNRISGIFESSVVDNAIILLKIGESKEDNISKFTVKQIDKGSLIDDKSINLKQSEFNSDSLDIEAIENRKILDKFLGNTELLGDITESSQGITVYAKVQGEKINWFRMEVEDKNTKPVIRGRDLSNYFLKWSDEYIQYGGWLWCPRNQKYFEKEKLFFRQTADCLIGTYIKEPMYCIDSVHSIINSPNHKNYNLKYILSILNSKFGNYLYRLLISETGKVFAQVKLTFLRKIPIKKIPTAEQKPFIDLVDKILAITKDSDYLENPTKQAKVEEYKHQIDQMVYKLYGLTEEEKIIVENFNKK